MIDLNLMNTPPAIYGLPVPTNQSLDYFRQKKILLVDDDVEVLVPMKILFWRLGCNPFAVTSPQDADVAIRETIPHLMVLDWYVDKSTGGDILTDCSEFFSNSEVWHNCLNRSKIKVVTFSCLEKNEIQFPEKAKKYFEHVEHWQKPFQFKKIQESIASLFHTTSV